ncbi:unnamed protein product, partial [marine sediment metagenome]
RPEFALEAYPLVLVIVVVIVYIGYCCYFCPVTTVLLVRHAEKSATPPQDPPLNATGQARAQTLVHVAGEAGVTAIYANQFIRTQQTVQPLATHVGFPVNQVDATDVEGLVDQVRSDHSGEVVLIVGHSNTIPQIIEELGGDPISPIAESEFDNMFIVTVFRLARTKVINLKYGDPS